jgi:hypothetical protein
VSEGTIKNHAASVSGSLLDARELAAATPRSLLATFEAILAELRGRQVVRTNDAPAGQYAEWLSCEVLGGALAPNSEKSFDLFDGAGRKIQVKSRVLRNGSRSERQLSPFRSFGFDVALVLLFDTQYRVVHAVEFTTDQVQALSTHRTHVNGHVLIATDNALSEGVDVIELFAAPPVG